MNRASRRPNLFPLILLILLTLISNQAKSQKELDVIKDQWLQYTDAPNALYHHLTQEGIRLLDHRLKEVAKVKTREDLVKRQKELKNTMWKVIGSFPEKTPLNPKIINHIKKDGYRVENLIYESLPGFYVTASLFVPDHLKKPAPAILFCTGHSQAAYRRDLYQLPLINLAKKGFVVLAFDPPGQGERSQYNPDNADSLFVNASTKQHSYPSTQVLLTGKSIARYFIWDGIRGIDYLVSRKEVDPKRIGVHGLSGGGTQTAYISALDDRVVAAAPAGYITSYQRLFESIGAQDGEQNFYHGISAGIDHGDFLEIRAPKPTLIMATTRDFFSIQGTRETYQEAKRFYDIAGKAENLQITEDDYGHGYTKKNREVMYAFFQKFLNLSGSPVEEEIEWLTPEELQKTSTGQLLTSIGGETIFSLNRKEADKIILNLQTLRKNPGSHLPGVIASAKLLSGYREPVIHNEPVFTGRFQKDGYVIEKYFVKGEGDYVIPYLLLVPDHPNHKAVMYLHPSGKVAEAMPGGEIEWFVGKGFTVLAPDLPGVGEMGAGVFRGDAFIGSISYNILYTSTLIGRSVLGILTGDVVRLTHLLRKRNDIHNIYGLARKELAPVLLHAAAFDKEIERLVLIEPYTSYESLATNEYYRPMFVNSIVPGALTAYDLPDLAASLAPRKLMMINTTDANGNRTDSESIEKALAPIKTAYQLKPAGEQSLKIVSLEPGGKAEVFLEEWIQ